MAANSWFYKLLEDERITFDDNLNPLDSRQLSAFKKCHELLKETATSLSARSKARKSIRLRARTVLTDILTHMCLEIFLLSTLVAPISKLATVKTKVLKRDLRVWWNSVAHPKGLTTIAERICQEYSLSPPQSASGGNLLGSLIVLDKMLSLLIAVGSEHDELQLQCFQTARTSTHDTNPLNQTPHGFIAAFGSSLTDPNLTATPELRVLENARLQGIEQVFDGYMCNAIRKVTVEDDLKAAVTMVFPRWVGPVQCLMSLDICERDVERLAMDLFGANVKWADQVLHVVVNGGTKIVIPHSEATLKGVLDEAIVKVFSPEIYHAVNECPIRTREITEGIQLTECVSMIFTKNGAIINISLGIRGGFQIQNKLYT